MSLFEMSLAGGAVILAAALIRAFGKNRLPIGTFTALWTLACARLVLPVRLPFRFSAWSLLERAGATAEEAVSQTVPTVGITVPTAPAVDITPITESVTSAAAGTGAAVTGLSPWTLAWALGACALALLLAAGYARSYRRFRAAEDVHSNYVNQQIHVRPTRRRVSVRVSDRVDAPLTYGVLRPVILLPRSMDGADEFTLGCVLAHELAHVRRFDAARKLALGGVLCLHWFNPLAWVMYVLANRDMERACDRAAVECLGQETRRGYALALLDLEARRGGSLAASGFSKNAIEERIHSIMKIRKKSFLSTLLAFALVLSVGTAFATAAAPETEPEETAPTVFSGDVMAASDGTVYVFTSEGKLVTMTEEEYKAIFQPIKVEWWTAEEYEQWLEQEKKDLQDCLGTKAWTNSDGWFVWTQEKIDETIAMYEQVLEQIKDGLLVSKTVDGRSDVTLMQDDGEVRDYLFSSEDGIVMYKYDGADTDWIPAEPTPSHGTDWIPAEPTPSPGTDWIPAEPTPSPGTDWIPAEPTPSPGTDTGWSSSDLYRGYAYTFNDGDETTTLGPYDTPEELLDALEEELTARVADGRLSEEKAEALLDGCASAADGGWTTRLMTGEEYDALQEQNEADAVERQELEEQFARLEEEQAEIEQRLAQIQEAEAAHEQQTALMERMTAWDETLAPYAPFGVTYKYDEETDDVQLYWNGERIRGIYDATAGVWITEHSGDGTWPEGTQEIIAVYTDGELTGLRKATESEQAEWDQFRAEAGVTGPVSALPPAEATASETDANVTDVPVSQAYAAFFSGLDADDVRGNLEPGGRVKAAEVTAAGGNTVSVGIETRMDASFTVSLRGSGGGMGQYVELKAGEMKTVTFYPEQADTYKLYLVNNGAYDVDFIVNYAVS